MPVTKVSDYNLLHITSAGEVTPDVAMGLIDQVEELESESEVAFNRFVDASNISLVSLSFDGIKMLAQRRKKYAGQSVKAAFWTPSSVVFGIARIYSSLISTTSINSKVFYDLESCSSWLNVPVEVLESAVRSNTGKTERT